jgi:arylsulfatase A-like enzyme
MSDDMGYGDLSCYGRKDYKTPNLDKLASQGIRFVNAYSAAPLCTPTRVAFMTGRYPARTPVGLIEPLTGNKDDSHMGLTPEFPSVATIMKSAGYRTALIGKWHLGSQAKHSPLKNGYEYFFGIRSGAADYISHKGTQGQLDLYENDSLVSIDGYLTELLSNKVIYFLKQEHSQPFFLTLTYNAPHWPWQGPTDVAYLDSVNFRQGGSPTIYAKMMRSLDDSIGEIMKTLDDENLTNNTIVIFTNDNGGERFSDNGGLSKGKSTLWEGGLRVPAFVRWPEKIKAGAVTQQIAITMDWAVTIMAIASAKPHNNFPVDGVDLTSVLKGQKEIVDRKLCWRTFQRAKQKAIRMNEWKYLQDDSGEYLFNLSNDPKEKTDLKQSHKSVFEKLKKEYTAWEKTVLQPIPL